MKIAYFGTANFSANILENLIHYKTKPELKLVVSQADKPVGRKKEIQETAVKQIAKLYNLEILQPKKIKGNISFFEKLKSLELDFIVVVAYGKIIPKEILDIPKYACINIHGSILPLYRGASPIQESLKNGDTKTGLTIMYMSEGMDEGDILAQKEIEIKISDKTHDIFKKFEEIGVDLLFKTLEKIISDNILPKKQNESLATYCSKIEKKDGKIDILHFTAKQIYNIWRAYYSWPGVFLFYKEKKLEITECFFDEEFLGGEIGKVIKMEGKKIGIYCKKGILILKKVKLEGKKEMDIMSFINGNKDFLKYKF